MAVGVAVPPRDVDLGPKDGFDDCSSDSIEMARLAQDLFTVVSRVQAQLQADRRSLNNERAVVATERASAAAERQRLERAVRAAEQAAAGAADGGRLSALEEQIRLLRLETAGARSESGSARGDTWITSTMGASQRQRAPPVEPTSAFGQLAQAVDRSETAGPPPMPVRRPPPSVVQQSPSSPALLPVRRPLPSNQHQSPSSPARSAKSASSGDVPQLSECGASSIRGSASAAGSIAGSKERRVKAPPLKKTAAFSTCIDSTVGHGPAASPPPMRPPPARTLPAQSVGERDTEAQQPSQHQEKRVEQRWADSDPSGVDELDKSNDILASLGADALWAQEVEGPPSKAPPPQSPIYRVMPAPPEARALNDDMPLPPSAEEQSDIVIEATSSSSAPAPSQPSPVYKAMPTRSPPPKCGVGAGSGGEPSPLRAWSAGGDSGSMGPPTPSSCKRASPTEPRRFKAPPAECAISSADGDSFQGSGRECDSQKHPPGAWDSWQGAKSPPETSHRREEHSRENTNGISQQKKVKAPPQRPH